MAIEYDEFLTKDDVSRIMELQPATDRQLSLLEYLGVSTPPNLTKNEASELVEAAKQDSLVRDRLDSWTIERLELHPDLYAAERSSFKHSRAELLLGQYRDFQSDMHKNGVRVRKLSIQEVNSLIGELDDSRPGWDREIYLNGLNHLLDLLKDRT
jgi:hypothetical protein